MSNIFDFDASKWVIHLPSQCIRSEWYGHSSCWIISSNSQREARRMDLRLCAQCLFAFWVDWSSTINFWKYSNGKKNRADLHRHGMIFNVFHSICFEQRLVFRSMPTVVHTGSMRRSDWSNNTRRIIPRPIQCTVSASMVPIPSRWFDLVALLSAARNDRNISLAQKIVDHIQRKFPDNADCLVSATVLLANTYSLSGNMSMASQIRWKLSQTGMKRKGGISSTVVNGEIVVSDEFASNEFKLNWFSKAISSTWSITPKIRGHLCWARSSKFRIGKHGSCTWFKLDNSTSDRGWEWRISIVWSQRTISNCLQFNSKANANSNSNY